VLPLHYEGINIKWQGLASPRQGSIKPLPPIPEDHYNIKKISIKPNTSFVERFNGTIKNRTKTMRCFEGFYPCQTTLTAFQIYYNFLRPHMSLDGKTPAQAAGIDIEFPDRWVSLIRTALISS